MQALSRGRVLLEGRLNLLAHDLADLLDVDRGEVRSCVIPVSVGWGWPTVAQPAFALRANGGAGRATCDVRRAHVRTCGRATCGRADVPRAACSRAVFCRSV